MHINLKSKFRAITREDLFNPAIAVKFSRSEHTDEPEYSSLPNPEKHQEII
jgi:hypothetical protein